MFKLPKNKSRITGGVVTAFACAVFVLFFSCETDVEEPIIIATFPLESGGILYGNWTPIKIGFSTPMAEADAAYLADAVKVRDHNYVAVSGAVTWEENAVYFQPAEKWQTGEKYTCFINGVFSALDGRVAVIKTELVFYAVSGLEVEAELPPVPEIEEVFFLRKTGDGGYEESLYDVDEYLNNVIEGECGLKIRFDEEMDFSELRKSLHIEPYRNYDIKVIDNRTLDIYFKAGVNPLKKISFTVQADMHSFLGEELKQDYEFTFTEWKSGFELSAMVVLQNVEYEDQDNELPIDLFKEKRFQVGAELYDNEMIIDFTYRFNVPLDLAAAIDSLSKIKLIADDERVEITPRLQEIGLFNIEYDQTWTDMEYGTLEDPYRYLIVIPGGIDGLNDGKGHYLKEDINVMLDVVDWDEIDPDRK
ncbi:MAG: hypothetical protein LBG27_10510 [Spirochaetaceae bacterium]|jgi:hypothetical protein|nr:hypothetical protein [Spirochaetaceae bacterium]